MLTVCTTSPDQALASLTDLATLLGATASSSGLMERSLLRASAWVERFITNDPAVPIRREVVMETLRGNGTPRLMLTRTPILGIQRLFDGTDTGTATEFCSTDFRIEDPDAGFVELTGDRYFSRTVQTSMFLDDYPRPNSPTRPWLCVYEAGYQFACATSTSSWVTRTTGRTLPEEIEQAVLLKAAEFYQGTTQGVQRMKVGPLEVNFSSEGQDMDAVSDLLNAFKRW